MGVKSPKKGQTQSENETALTEGRNRKAKVPPVG
jgi:hypothetical protein